MDVSFQIRIAFQRHLREAGIILVKAGIALPGHFLYIIALSANAFDEDRKKSLAAGMNEHLMKPINSKQLFTTLIKYLRK